MTDADDTDGGDGDGADDIPLDITGHDDRADPRGNGTEPSGAGDADDGSADGNEPEAVEPGDPAVDSEVVEPGEPSVDDEETVETGFGGFSVADEVDAVDEDHVDDEEPVEPVELLVQLAEEGRIDPWDIDIVTVTDAFLDRLDEADLRTGGRALFYASVLLRLKSDAMLGDDEPEEEWTGEPWEQGFGPGPREEGEPVDPIDGLEREMERRLERRGPRGGVPQTLDELVRELRERERDSWWKESRTYDTSDSPTGYARGTHTLDYHSGDDLRMDEEPTVDDVTGTAHDEHMEDIINDVYTSLREQYDQGRAEVLFAEVDDAGGSRVQTFLGLLFLAHRGQVRLEQDETFGDLWVQDPGAIEGSEEAIAD